MSMKYFNYIIIPRLYDHILPVDLQFTYYNLSILLAYYSHIVLPIVPITDNGEFASVSH